MYEGLQFLFRFRQTLLFMCFTFYVEIHIQTNHFRTICDLTTMAGIKRVLPGIDIDVGVVLFFHIS